MRDLADESGLVRLDSEFGYVDRDEKSPRQFHPHLVLNSDNDSMLRALRHELRKSASFYFSVAFVSARALALLKQEFVEFEGTGRIVTSTYLGFNSPEAFSELLALTRLPRSTIDVRLHTSDSFHPKGYVFQRSTGFTAILGSSNLTASALASNHEWNLRVSGTRDSDLFAQLSNVLDREHSDSESLSQEWIDLYSQSYVPPARLPRLSPPALIVAGTATDEVRLIEPNAMQMEALARIDEKRAAGATRALVISATGTGKTILSALDVRAVDPARMLFVVHREQILDRAIEEFQNVLGLPSTDFGKIAGSSRQFDRRFTFATVQSLSRKEVLERFAPDSFDYILIDEVHRAGAETYTHILDHFRPSFLLGMTATPERGDGANIFAMFDFNVPYEIRLDRALQEDMLTPFHYYGVADLEFDDGTAAEAGSDLPKLVAKDRVEHLLRTIAIYGQSGVAPCGLIFCSRKEEAALLSSELNQRTLGGRALRTVSLTGDDPISARERSVQLLESGKLDYILTVDIFNEGVDIPSVNQIVMLRQTKSSIVFVQQLGRGLRKAKGKEYVVVIDFIGNYTNNYLIPIALFGDESLNKESLRKSLIAAEESGVLAGLSSVRFDRISQERVLRSITAVKLNSPQNLKSAIEQVKNRIGRVPFLGDFLDANSADPMILATRMRSYPELLQRLRIEESGLTEAELKSLSVLSREHLSSKRPHELLVLRELVTRTSLSLLQLRELLITHGLAAHQSVVTSVVRSLTLEFNTQPERDVYGVSGPAVTTSDGSITLAPFYLESLKRAERYRLHVEDLIDTGLQLIRERYAPSLPFTRGKQYSRKDASRLLRWDKNQSGTLNGYKIDAATATCPIFVTLHKAATVSAGTAYADELTSTQTMRWSSRNPRRLDSKELAPIINNEATLHVFMQKDNMDATEETQFYYLGEAKAKDAFQTEMMGNKGQMVPVVHMDLHFATPVEAGLFDYFHSDLTR